MNRRKFVLSTSAAMALAGTHAMAQRTTRSQSTVATSEFTGATVDYSASGLVLKQQHVDEEEGAEHFHFEVPQDGRFDINFWPTALGDTADYFSWYFELWESNLGNMIEVIDRQTVGDGGWITWSLGERLCYYEYQLGSYPEHDLVILLEADKSIFQEYLEKAQLVLVDELEPMLFVVDSDIAAVASRNSSAGSTTSTSSRSTRTTRNETTTETPESNTSTSTSTTESDSLQAVVDHRSAFHESFAEFIELLEVVGDDTATEDESAAALAAMANISLIWQTYPSEAAGLTFSSGQSELRTTYLSWADAVGAMGTSFEQFFMGAAPIDDYLAAFETFKVIDADLLTLLEAGSQSRNLNANMALAEPLRILDLVSKRLGS